MSDQLKKENQINKEAQETTSTQSLYETVDSSGKKHVFTAADLVQGHGYLGEGSNKFRPKKWKGHSASEIVTKPGYGKVRNTGTSE